MKFITFSLALTSLSVFGQSTLLGVNETKSIFSKMSNEQAADLSLRNKVGSCKSFQLGTSGASFMFSLNYKEGIRSKTERFGKLFALSSIKKAQFVQLNPGLVQVDAQAVNTNKSYLTSSFTKSTSKALQFQAYSIPIFSRELILSAKAQLGQRVKQLVAENKCGNVNFESFQKSLPEMQNDVAFYMENNVLTCTVSDFERRVRKPGSCEYESVHSALPTEACKLLYQIKSTKSGRGTQEGTASVQSTSPNSLPLIKMVHVPPKLSVMTPEIRKNLLLDKLLIESPELALVAESAQFINAEHVIPVHVLELLESKNITPEIFDDLTISSQEKLDLISLVSTHDAIKLSPDHIQFSSEISSVVDKIRLKANLYSQLNVIDPEIWSIPSKKAISQHLDLQLAPISSLLSSQFVYDLSCITRYVTPALFVEVSPNKILKP